MKTWKTPELENLTIEATACGPCDPAPDYNCASGSEEECNPCPPKKHNPPQSPCEPPQKPGCGGDFGWHKGWR